MEKITELLGKLENLGELIPKLDTLTGWVQWLVSLAVRVGPVCILVLGLIYLLIPPKEANRKAGYRSYFGMGSVQAWRFTQRLAGVVFGGMGILLTILGIIGCVVMSSGNPLNAADKALVFIIIQLALSVAAYLFVEIFVAMHYDKEGNPKK